jgi:hypothetical protein
MGQMERANAAHAGATAPALARNDRQKPLQNHLSATQPDAVTRGRIAPAALVPVSSTYETSEPEKPS